MRTIEFIPSGGTRQWVDVTETSTFNQICADKGIDPNNWKFYVNSDVEPTSGSATVGSHVDKVRLIKATAKNN